MPVLFTRMSTGPIPAPTWATPGGCGPASPTDALPGLMPSEPHDLSPEVVVVVRAPVASPDVWRGREVSDGDGVRQHAPKHRVILLQAINDAAKPDHRLVFVPS